MKSKLRVLRAEREWTQADLAARLQVSRQTINAIETSARKQIISPSGIVVEIDLRTALLTEMSNPPPIMQAIPKPGASI